MICSRCKLDLDAAEFASDKRRPSGIGSWCKPCTAEDSRRRYAKNRLRKLAQNKRWYEENREYRIKQTADYARKHPEMRAASAKKWREKNQEVVAAYRKAYNSSNREQLNAWHRAAREKYPERYRVFCHQARAQRFGLENCFTVEEWLSLVADCGERCVKCGTHASEIVPSAANRKLLLEVDHIVPLAIGGSSEISNIQPLCWHCNAHKHLGVADYRPASIREKYSPEKRNVA